MQVLPRGISSPRLLELHVLDATFTAGDAALALLRSCPALQRVAVAPRPCAAGAEIALVVQCESLVALGALPSLQCLELYVDKASTRGSQGLFQGAKCMEGGSRIGWSSRFDSCAAWHTCQRAYWPPTTRALPCCSWWEARQTCRPCCRS